MLCVCLLAVPLHDLAKIAWKCGHVLEFMLLKKWDTDEKAKNSFMCSIIPDKYTDVIDLLAKYDHGNIRYDDFYALVIS